MPTTPRNLLTCLLFAAITVAAAHTAEATLGQAASSIATDSTALSAVHRATIARTSYTVQELASDSGTIREYVSAAGIVFAIAWNGLVHPDLSTLLGSYAGEYQTALRQTVRKKGSRHLHVTSHQVVVEKWGHMRDLQGRAYVPALLPAGVAIDEIR